MGISSHLGNAVSAFTMLLGPSEGGGISYGGWFLIEMSVMLMLAKYCSCSQTWFLNMMVSLERAYEVK